MNDIRAIPYRTPACDKHLQDNESDTCPWCELELLRHIATAASVLTTAIDHGFASQIRPDIARAELNHWLAEYGGWSSMATVHDGHRDDG